MKLIWFVALMAVVAGCGDDRDGSMASLAGCAGTFESPDLYCEFAGPTNGDDDAQALLQTGRAATDLRLELATSTSMLVIWPLVQTYPIPGTELVADFAVASPPGDVMMISSGTLELRDNGNSLVLSLASSAWGLSTFHGTYIEKSN